MGPLWGQCGPSWKVRNIEHTAGEGNSRTSGRPSAAKGSYFAIDRRTHGGKHGGNSHPASVQSNRHPHEERPSEEDFGGRRRAVSIGDDTVSIKMLLTVAFGLPQVI